MIFKQTLSVAIILLLLCGSFSSCTSKADDAIAEACKDGTMSDSEIANIATLLRKDKREATKYRDDESIRNYIRQHNGCLNSGATTQPTPSVSNAQKPVYNVFIENSMSMDGYVRGNSDFKNAIYGFLSDVLLKN